jgi:hypothetical protein
MRKEEDTAATATATTAAGSDCIDFGRSEQHPGRSVSDFDLAD